MWGQEGNVSVRIGCNMRWGCFSLADALRNFNHLFGIPSGSKWAAHQEHKAMCDAISDDEAKSVLYVLHFSEPCPQCTLACKGKLCGMFQ